MKRGIERRIAAVEAVRKQHSGDDHPMFFVCPVGADKEAFGCECEEKAAGRHYHVVHFVTPDEVRAKSTLDRTVINMDETAADF